MVGSIGGNGGYGNLQNFQISGGYNNSGRAGQADPEEKKPVLNPGEDLNKAPGKKSSPAECETCKNRKYQDGSDENDVSFQTAQHIDPNSAGAKVRAHEQEHVVNAYEKAKENDGKVVSVGVSIHTAVCPECGRVYVSGGETRSTIAYKKGGKDDEDKNGVNGVGNEKNDPYRQQAGAINRMLNTGVNASFTA